MSRAPRTSRRSWPAVIVAAVATILVASGCGGSGGVRSRLPKSTVIALMASAPNSLDPAVGDNPQALEADGLVYTPLLTYFHADGVSGTRVIAGLAEHLPSISAGGTVYTFTLLPGLKYSNGRPVRASDFSWAVERAVKLWRGAGQFITGHIVGAARFASGRANTISGILANDATGQITIHLTAPYGAFENVLAMPALAPVPTGTPLREQQTPPPPGVGPYQLEAVVPGKSFSLVRNPEWQKLGVQYVTAGHLDVDVRITGEEIGNALSVLDNKADALDWPEQLPSALLDRIKRQASGRFFKRTMEGTELIFLNVTRSPFSNQLAREAVRAGLDQDTMAQLDSGMLLKGCYLLTPNLYGHPSGACPDGNKSGDGDLALAKSLVKQSGTDGAPVVVWSAASSPIRQWMTYYASMLNEIGFRASLRVVPDSSYSATIEDAKRDPQTGYAELLENVPNPVDLYQSLTDDTITPSGTSNWSQVDDPYLNATVRALAAVPASTLAAVYSFWRQLERYVAGKAYLAVFGYPTFPELVSSRVNFRDVIFSPVAGYDWSSFRLK